MYNKHKVAKHSSMKYLESDLRMICKQKSEYYVPNFSLH